MYLDFFGLKELPFSIAPDPRYLYMSERHREALAHLLYGVSGQGGFVVLTGEVGTGKTTICRCFLNQIPNNTDVAFIVNPKLSARELMASICDELHLSYPDSASIKVLNDLINKYLLEAHANNRHTVLIIDEAQNLRVDVLEQLRLLTNLETSEKKLLQIILLGQPELREVLAQNELRQLAQRVTARYHLVALSKVEVGAYVNCRLAVAGRRGRLFSHGAINALYKLSGGIPRLINLICDRALLGAYAMQAESIEAGHVKHAYKEIQGPKARTSIAKTLKNSAAPKILAGTSLVLLLAWMIDYRLSSKLEELEELKQLPSPKAQLAYEAEPAPKTKPSVVEAKTSPALIDPEHESALVQLSGTRSESASLSSMDLGANMPVAELTPASALDISAVELASDSKASAPILSNISSLKHNKDDKYFAFESVFDRWSVDYPQAPFMLACSFAEMNGLRCLHKTGNWRSLLKLDRPAVLTLIDDYGQALHIALLAIESQQALISYHHQKYWVALDEIDRYWFGEYSIIWKLPPYKSTLVVPGQKSEDVWLRSNLSRLNRKKLGKNDELSEQIKFFQSSVGLVPDGIPGSMTLIQMNSRLRLDVPKLLGGV